MFTKIYTFFKWNHHYKRWMNTINKHKTEAEIVNELCSNYEEFMEICSEYNPEFEKVYKKVYPKKLKISDAKKLPTTADMRLANARPN